MVFIQRDIPPSSELCPFTQQEMQTHTTETALLRTSAAFTMIGITQQMARLSTLASNVFTSLLQDYFIFLGLAQETADSKRQILDLGKRVDNVAKAMPAIEKCIQEIPFSRLMNQNKIRVFSFCYLFSFLLK